MRRRLVPTLVLVLAVAACSAADPGPSAGDGIEDLEVPDDGSVDAAPPDRDGEGSSPGTQDAGSAGDRPTDGGPDDDTTGAGIPMDEPVDDASELGEDFAERVLEVLDERYLSVIEVVREVGVDELDATGYAVSIAPVAAQVFTEEAEADAVERIVEFESNDWFNAELEPVSSDVEELRTATSDCISLVVERDAGRLYDVPLDGRWYVTLRPHESGGDDADTIWRFAAETPDTGEGTADGCA